MKYLRERVLEPILIPLVALIVIAFGAVNLSRLFLATSHSGRAVLVATLISVLILAGAIVATTREHIDRGTLLAAAAVLGVVLGTTGFIAQEADLDHLAHEDDAEDTFTSEITVIAIDIDFPEKQVEAANGGGILVNYVNEGAIFHTWVVEGFEDVLKLETPGGAADRDVIALDPGDYTFYCDVPGHRAAGMEANLTVTQGAAEAGGETGAETGGETGGEAEEPAAE